MENARVGALRDRLVAGVVSGAVGVRETVPPEAKVAGSAHLLVEGVESEALLYLLDRAGVCASAASACASGAHGARRTCSPRWASIANGRAVRCG